MLLGDFLLSFFSSLSLPFHFLFFVYEKTVAFDSSDFFLI